jgi:hypothetical protein
MKKLRLDLDELDVASFDLDETQNAVEEEGTVFGHTTVDSCYRTLCCPTIDC